MSASSALLPLARGPLKVAVVGSGASGFYLASRLFRILDGQEKKREGVVGGVEGAGAEGAGVGAGEGAGVGIGIAKEGVRVDVYEKLWAPYGLVRYGVAPDHPEVKNCMHKFEVTARDERFKFFGGVEVVPSSALSSTPNTIPDSTQEGVRIPLSTLRQNYTHVVLANGAGQSIEHPLLPRKLPYCVQALDLVKWYTLYPSSSSPSTPAFVPPLEEIEDVTIIGLGNVSLDIARLLLMPVKELEVYDVPESVLSVLRKSRVKRVRVIGRRGPGEMRFGVKEVREMMRLPGVTFDGFEKEEGMVMTRQQSRLVDLLDRGSEEKEGEKRWSIEFYKSPVGYSVQGRKVTLEVENTVLDPVTRQPLFSSNATKTTIQTDMVVTSLGFKSDEMTTPFWDPKLGHVRTAEGGRVVDPANGEIVQGVYACGWAGMGARGVLGSTMIDSFGVAESVVEDWKNARNKQIVDLDDVPEEVKELTGFEDWLRVDEEERRRGSVLGKERERMDWDQVKAFLRR